VPLRQRVAQALVGAAILIAAFVTVGLTAPADGPLTIGIRPVFLRVDPEAIAQSRARALGLEVDVKLWTLHLHFAWSAIPLTTDPDTSTKPDDSLL
jgi:hypothetical protein